MARTRLQRPGFKTSSWRQVNSLSHDSDDDDEDDDDDDYGHIGDVMLVWRKGNINRTVYHYNGAQWYEQFLQVG